MTSWFSHFHEVINTDTNCIIDTNYDKNAAYAILLAMGYQVST